MGSADSKLEASIASSSRSSATGQASSTDSDAVLVRAPCGVRLRRLEGNNFLGRLADAKKFTTGGGGGGGRVGGMGLIGSLSQRLARRATDSSGGSAGSGGCVTPAADSGCISPMLQRAQPSLPPMTSTPIWSLAGGHQYHPQHRDQPERGHHHHEHHRPRHHRQQQQHGPGVHQAVPPSCNLTALLARGFDPAEYERREREHRRRMAKARPRQHDKNTSTATNSKLQGMAEPLHKD